MASNANIATSGEYRPGVVSLRQAQKEFTRQRLLAAGLRRFAAKGVAGTTVEDIAREAGATRATFYLHFGTKADLVGALSESLLAGVTELNAALRPAVASGDRAAIVAWLETAFDFWEHRRAIAAAQDEAAAIDPVTAERRARSFGEGIDAIVAGLGDAKRFGAAGRRSRALLMYAQLQNVFHRFMEGGWEVDRRETLAVMADMWMAAIEPKVRRRT